MLSFIFALFLSPSFASSTKCPDVNGVVKDVIFTQENDCDLAKQIATIFNGMAKTFGVAPEVTIIFGGPLDNASFDLGHTIEIPYRMAFYGNYGQEYPVTMESLITSAAHEYGHAIFNEAVKKEFSSPFGEVLKKLEKISERKSALLNGATDPSFPTDMSELMKSDIYRVMTKQLTPYSEFYADTLAVFFYQSKTAMLEALYYPEMDTYKYNFIRMRDFSSRPDPRWDYLMSEEHAKLALTRTYVGESLWPANLSEAKLLAEKILKAILRVTRANIAKGEDLDPASANSQLIEALQQDSQR